MTVSLCSNCIPLIIANIGYLLVGHAKIGQNCVRGLLVELCSVSTTISYHPLCCLPNGQGRFHTDELMEHQTNK